MKLFAKFAFGLIPLLSVGNLSAQEKIYKGLNHNWKLIDDKFWQIQSNTPVEEPKQLDPHCPAGMIHVKGSYLLDIDSNPLHYKTVDVLEKFACKKWLNRTPVYRDRCLEYDRDAWKKIASTLKRKPMNYCIDKYEGNAKKGEFPIVMITYTEAESLCKSQSKDLCDEEQWEMACEGDADIETIPLGYGYTRDANACVIDRGWTAFHANALFPRNTTAAIAELDRLWRGEASGSMPNCKTPFGVMDMTGNVDEIVRATRPSKYKLALHGGAWTNVRNRCRAVTRSHSEDFACYQASFRCCKNVN